MAQVRFLNIHISRKAQLAMINMPLKWHHIRIFFFNIVLNMVLHGFWLSVLRFYMYANGMAI